MTEEQELDRWREEWQGLGGRAELTKELAAQAVKDTRRVRLAVVGEVVAAALTSAFGLWSAIGSHGRPAAVVLCAGLFLFNGVWLTRLFTLRGQDEGAALDDFVARRRQHLDRDLAWNRFARKATIALGVAIAPYAAWIAWAQQAFYRAEPWRAVVGFGGIVVILAALLLFLAKKRAKILEERERFETLVAERTLA